MLSQTEPIKSFSRRFEFGDVYFEVTDTYFPLRQDVRNEIDVLGRMEIESDYGTVNLLDFIPRGWEVHFGYHETHALPKKKIIIMRDHTWRNLKYSESNLPLTEFFHAVGCSNVFEASDKKELLLEIMRMDGVGYSDLNFSGNSYSSKDLKSIRFQNELDSWDYAIKKINQTFSHYEPLTEDKNLTVGDFIKNCTNSYTFGLDELKKNQKEWALYVSSALGL